MDEKFIKRYRSFCNSLDSLAEAKERDMSDSFVLSGTSAKFSITFDLAWKVMKDILVQHYAISGFVAGSPREVLREAFKAEMISGDVWMEMLKIRNPFPLLPAVFFASGRAAAFRTFSEAPDIPWAEASCRLSSL